MKLKIESEATKTIVTLTYTLREIIDVTDVDGDYWSVDKIRVKRDSDAEAIVSGHPEGLSSGTWYRLNRIHTEDVLDALGIAHADVGGLLKMSADPRVLL